MAKGFKKGAKVKVFTDDKWVMGKITTLLGEAKTVAVIERLDLEGAVEHRTVYARVDDLRPAKDDTAS